MRMRVRKGGAKASVYCLQNGHAQQLRGASPGAQKEVERSFRGEATRKRRTEEAASLRLRRDSRRRATAGGICARAWRSLATCRAGGRREGARCGKSFQGQVGVGVTTDFLFQ